MSSNRIDSTPYGLGGLDLPTVVRSNAAVGFFFEVLHGLKFCPREVHNSTQQSGAPL